MCVRSFAARSTSARPLSSSFHPSGDPSPSKQDIALTREVVQAGKPLGIAVHDHIVVGAKGHASMRAMGLL